VGSNPACPVELIGARVSRPYSGVENMANQQVAEKKSSGGASWFEPVREYFRDTIGELRKVHWPTRMEVRNLSIIVLAVTFAMSLLLGLFDFIFEQTFYGILKTQPDLISVAVLVFSVLVILVLVIFAGRE
jgi:preprotein translocase subunit SecE